MPEYRIWHDVDGHGSPLLANCTSVMDLLNRVRSYPLAGNLRHEFTVRLDGEVLADIARDCDGNWTAEVLARTVYHVDLPYATRIIHTYWPNGLGRWTTNAA